MTTIPRDASRREFLKRTAAAAATGVAAPMALNLSAIGRLAAADADDYKALVCIFLYGANDHYNTVVPYDAESHAAYARLRPELALGRGSLGSTVLEGPGGALGGRQFALAPQLADAATLWRERRMNILLNVGPLVQPTTKTQFVNRSAPIPPKVFSHNDQQSVWQSLAAEGASSGWGGRLTDAFLDTNAEDVFSAISIAGDALFLSGNASVQYRVSPEGSIPLVTKRYGSLFGSSEVARTMERLMTEGGSGHLMAQALRSTTRRSLDAHDKLTAALAAAPPPAAAFQEDRLGAQLRMVARIIAAREALGVKRQVFFVGAGDFDLHDGLVSRHPPLLTMINGALDSFYRATEELGVGDQVTAFTASDFGRTLTSNGDGTDHGWGQPPHDRRRRRQRRALLGHRARARRRRAGRRRPGAAAADDLDRAAGRLAGTLVRRERVGSRRHPAAAVGLRRRGSRHPALTRRDVRSPIERQRASGGGRGATGFPATRFRLPSRARPTRHARWAREPLPPGSTGTLDGSTDQRPFAPGRLNHVALVVDDLAVASATWRSLLGATVSAPQALAGHGVTVAFVDLPNTRIELLEPPRRRLAGQPLSREARGRRHAPRLPRGRGHRPGTRASDRARCPRARRRRAENRRARATRCCSCTRPSCTARCSSSRKCGRDASVTLGHARLARSGRCLVRGCREIGSEATPSSTVAIVREERRRESGGARRGSGNGDTGRAGRDTLPPVPPEAAGESTMGESTMSEETDTRAADDGVSPSAATPTAMPPEPTAADAPEGRTPDGRTPGRPGPRAPRSRAELPAGARSRLAPPPLQPTRAPSRKADRC